MCTAQAQTPSSAHTEAAQPCQLRAPAAPASTGPGWLWEPGSSPVLCFHQPRSPGFLQLASSSGAAQMLLKARSYNSIFAEIRDQETGSSTSVHMDQTCCLPPTWRNSPGSQRGARGRGATQSSTPERGNVCAHLPKRHRLVPANTHTLYKP